MARPNAALGFPTNFPTDQFNRAIQFAMQMGLPNDATKRPTFIFPSTGKTYWKDGVELPDPPLVDQDGRPLDPEIEVRQAADRRVQVDCAFEVQGGGFSGEGPVGNFPLVRVVVTLLAAQYAEVEGCQALEYNGDRYLYDHEPENYGLFDANVHTLIFVAEDET